jgi:uncharacterized membrane protein
MATDRRHDPFKRRAAVTRDDAGIEFSRVVAFSDGVFAIAITLLVLALHVPRDVDDLGQALLDLNGDLFAYALSFAVVGKFWLSHHRFYGSLARFDGMLMGLNIFYLAWVVLVPFSSELLGEFGEDPASTMFYAANMVGASGTFILQIRYSYRHGLIRDEAKEMERRYAGPANYIFVAVFVASIPVGYVNTYVAQAMWLTTFLAGRRASDWLAKRQEAAERRL